MPRIISRTEIPVPDSGSGVQLPEQPRGELIRLRLSPVRHHGQGRELQLLGHLLSPVEGLHLHLHLHSTLL